MTELLSHRDLLPDDVWRRLDPGAARLPRWQTVLILAAIVVAVVLVVAGYIVWTGGYVSARIDSQDEASGYSWSATSGGPFTIDLPIANDGRTAITVTSVGRSGPGLALATPAGRPFRLAPGNGIIVHLTYTVTDCAAVPSGTWAVPVTVRMWWGSETVHVRPGPIEQDQPAGVYAYSGTGTDPFGRPWQKALAVTSCREHG